MSHTQKCLRVRYLNRCEWNEGEAWATGWGFTGEEGVFNPKVLSEIKQNVISNEECKPMLAPVLENLGKTRLCVSHGDGGISIGDKGGPLYMVKDDGKMYQVGIASLLPGKFSGCFHFPTRSTL